MKALVVLVIAGPAIACSDQGGRNADVAGSAGYPHLESWDEQKRQTEEHFRRNLEPDCKDEHSRARN